MSVPTLPPMSVEFYPNTGMEVGWSIALDRALRREGWIVEAEVQVGPSSIVDLIAYLGGITLVIEIKARAAGPDAVRQLGRYLGFVRPGYPHAIGVLAAPAITGTVSELPSNSYFLPLVQA